MATIRKLILCLVAASCQTTSDPWECKETKSLDPRYQACRVSQKSNNIFRGMELEFVRTSSRLRAYLNVFSLQFAPSDSDETKTEVTIQVKDETATFLSARMAGGQRLLLPEEGCRLLIQALAQGEIISIRAGRFDTKVFPGEFSKKHCQKINLYEKNGIY